MTHSRVDLRAKITLDIGERIKKGEAEYGTTLCTNNGRDALWDAYEEAIDMALYLKQAIFEWEEVEIVNVGTTVVSDLMNYIPGTTMMALNYPTHLWMLYNSALGNLLHMADLLRMRHVADSGYVD